MVRTLILWRHAKSSWEEPGLPDIARPLAPRGLKAGPKQAKWIATQFRPDRVICSPARRAYETWHCLALHLPQSLPVVFDNRVYEAGWDQLLGVIRETPDDVEQLLLVGHSPGLEDLTAVLAEPPGEKFATAACAVLQFSGAWREVAPGKAQLTAFRRPRRKKLAA
jgi:phosphohistidine phosphatase